MYTPKNIENRLNQYDLALAQVQVLIPPTKSRLHSVPVEWVEVLADVPYAIEWEDAYKYEEANRNHIVHVIANEFPFDGFYIDKGAYSNKRDTLPNSVN